MRNHGDNAKAEIIQLEPENPGGVEKKASGMQSRKRGEREREREIQMNNVFVHFHKNN